MNVYEGCMISLVWNYAPDSSTVTKTQIDRATYAIKSHTNYVGNLSTEFQTINKTTYNWTGSSYYGDSFNNLHNNYYPICYSYLPYYWHPYKNFFYFVDYNQRYGTLQFVSTCFQYNTGPASACDANFVQGAAPTFKLSTITGCCGTNGYTTWNPNNVFTHNNVYMAYQWTSNPYYHYECCWDYWSDYYWMIYKMSISGASCTAYTETIGSLIFQTPMSSSYSIPQIGTIP